MVEQARYYNDLIPPSNPAYAVIGKKVLLCYYCNSGIYQTEPEAGYRQRTIYMRGMWRHRTTDELHCDKALIRPDKEIDDPRCGCCGTQTEQHEAYCSHAGKPRFRATSMSDKEHELIKVFGWDGKGEKNWENWVNAKLR